jgi:hypothetical protein
VQTGICWDNLREGDHLEDLGIDGKMVLKWIFTKWDGGLNWIGMAQDIPMAEFCECGNEPSGFICGGILTGRGPVGL